MGRRSLSKLQANSKGNRLSCTQLSSSRSGRSFQSKIGNVEIAFTNSALYMLIAVAIIALLMIGFTSRKALVPGRLQAIAEISYEFIAANLQRSAGSEGMKFFPLVFSLFMFVLVLNVISLIPHTFGVTAPIILNALVAMVVFLTVIVYGFWKHGFR